MFGLSVMTKEQNIEAYGCEHPGSYGTKYCPECGRLRGWLSACGRQNLLWQKFCPDCGEAQRA